MTPTYKQDPKPGLWTPGTAYKLGMLAAALGSAAVNLRFNVAEVAFGNLLLFFGCLVLNETAKNSRLVLAQIAVWSFMLSQVTQQTGSAWEYFYLALSAALLSGELRLRLAGGRLL